MEPIISTYSTFTLENEKNKVNFSTLFANIKTV